MIHYQFHNSKILFVGINPHPGSYARGVPFSNNKMFWYLLNRAGLLKEEVTDLKNEKMLKYIYQNKFNKVYKLGFINVIDRPTRDVTLLKKGEEKNGQTRIAKTIKSNKPKVVCFVGKIAYAKFSGLNDFSFGWQEDIYSSKAFVMHFPLHGKADIRVEELKLVAQVAGLSNE